MPKHISKISKPAPRRYSAAPSLPYEPWLIERLKNPRFAPGHEEDLENIDNFQKRVPKKLFIEFDTP